MVVVPIMEVVKRGVLIRSAIKLGNGFDGISTRRTLNGGSVLPTTIGVVGTP